MRPTIMLAVALALGASPCFSHGLSEVRGRLLCVSVTVDGIPTRLYEASEGPERWYLEAHEGSRYTLDLRNRSRERLGLLVKVDGLNVVSGSRESRTGGRGRPGRLYVLDAWGRMRIRGWRSSLKDVHRFTFVDEKQSYAVRSGQANPKMGWIEIAVYRERQPLPVVEREHPRGSRTGRPGESQDRAAAGAATEGATSPASPTAKARRPQPRSYPGTGWGDRVQDRAVVVDFRTERRPSESFSLRYEYRDALYALGILPPRHPSRNRLWEREHGDEGFAKPPIE